MSLWLSAMMYDAHKRAMWRFVHGILMVGIAYLILSTIFPDAMRQDEYGAAAYAVPAEIWSLGFISGSGCVIYGLHINGRMPRFSPVLRLIGLVFLMSQYTFLAISAFPAANGATVFVFSALFFIPNLGHFALTEARQARARWKVARNVTG